MDGANWTECTSPKTYNLSTSNHTYNFKARSIDTAGDSDPTPDTYNIIKNPSSEVSGIIKQNEVPYGPVIVVAEKNDKPDNKFNYTTRDEGIFFLKGVPDGIYAVDVLHISGNILKCTEREAKEGSPKNNWEISVTELEQNKSVIPTPKKCVTKVETVKSKTSYQVTLNQTATPIPPEKRTPGPESNIAEIKIQINATPETLKQIDRVTYKLDPTFKSPIVTQVSPDNGFALSFTAWGKFDLLAIVYFKDGQSTILSLPLEKWRV